MSTYKQAADLHDQWINGNRKDVLRAITAMSSMRAACVASRMTALLLDHDHQHGTNGAFVFVEAMDRRLGE